jgi:hypothetical protein
VRDTNFTFIFIRRYLVAIIGIVLLVFSFICIVWIETLTSDGFPFGNEPEE